MRRNGLDPLYGPKFLFSAKRTAKNLALCNWATLYLPFSFALCYTYSTQFLCETACKHDEASLATRDFYVSTWMDPISHRPQVCVPRPLSSCNWTKAGAALQPTKRACAQSKRGGRFNCKVDLQQRPSGCKGKAAAASVVCSCRNVSPLSLSFQWSPIRLSGLHPACLMRLKE